ncbi:hypothetical protein [Frigoriglobus tundricola]|uniref:Uncharacterized protein n=1 Tax=Frigoriglobus tundricola TaxID=2774151 RepID=A0A6M5YHQ8_9BACT|nr:hypothetical protein [Frigoriglobus tundricola]QJW93498.1 hypothetical protein FTUN_1004 [Frigoriglobus tundricola]
MPTTPIRVRRVWRLPCFARLCVAVLVLFSGCRSPYPVYVVHRPGDAPKAGPVPYAATYVLGAVNETDASVASLQRCAIQEQFQVGFIREPDGTLVAYAGGRKFPLPEGHYVWQIAPESQKSRGEVALVDASRVLGAVGAALGYIGAAAAYVGFMMLGAAAKSGGHN